LKRRPPTVTPPLTSPPERRNHTQVRRVIFDRLVMKSCWIYRRHAQQGFGATMNPDKMPNVDFKFTSMHELVKAHQEQRRVK
jgi:hypothetical protein